MVEGTFAAQLEPLSDSISRRKLALLLLISRSLQLKMDGCCFYKLIKASHALYD